MKKISLLVLGLVLYSSAFTQNMKEMDMSKKETKEQPAVTFTCPMHPEIHATKPGNCPKCGMKLIMEKPKLAVKPAIKKSGEMEVMKDATKSEKMVMNDKADMQMDGMQMPKKDSAKKMDHMGDKKADDMGNMEMPKAKIEPIKTIRNNIPSRTVRYDLYIADTTVSFTGKTKRAIAVNGQIPMPTLTFTQGDTAEIYVHNELNEETSLHWHGLFLPNQYDGVPNLTQMPIKPHTTHLYKFPIIQSGTHWYHSHTGLQEQIGMYGMFIMNKREEWDIPTIPLILSEWTDMNPEEVHRSLHAATDWFAVQKGSTQSYAEAIKQGKFKTKLSNE